MKSLLSSTAFVRLLIILAALVVFRAYVFLKMRRIRKGPGKKQKAELEEIVKTLKFDYGYINNGHSLFDIGDLRFDCDCLTGCISLGASFCTLSDKRMEKAALEELKRIFKDVEEDDYNVEVENGEICVWCCASLDLAPEQLPKMYDDIVRIATRYGLHSEQNINLVKDFKDVRGSVQKNSFNSADELKEAIEDVYAKQGINGTVTDDRQDDFRQLTFSIKFIDKDGEESVKSHTSLIEQDGCWWTRCVDYIETDDDFDSVEQTCRFSDRDLAYVHFYNECLSRK